MRLTLACAVLTLPCLSAAHAQTCLLEVERLKPTSQAGAGTGTSIAVDGGLVAIGSPGFGSTGAVFLYDAVGASWEPRARIHAQDAVVGDQFGAATALDGTWLAVGAPGDDDSSGSVALFHREGGEWVQRGKLKAFDALPGATFGASVALDRDTLVVGSPTWNRFGFGAGYVYLRTGMTWNLQQRLELPEPKFLHYFGRAVDVEGDAAVLTTLSSRRAHVFRRVGATWIQEAILEPSDPVGGQSEFGASVALDGDRIVVGDPKDHAQGDSSGAVYVFDRSGTGWSTGAKLLAKHSIDKAHFGLSVALEGDRLAARATDIELGFGGSATIFEWTAGAWIEGPRFVTGLHGDSGPLVLWRPSFFVGLPFDTPGGSVAVFRVLSAPSTYCTAKPSSCGTLPGIGSSGTPQASATGGFLVTCTRTRGTKAGLLLYTDQGRDAAPFAGGTLCVDAASVQRSILLLDTLGTAGLCDGELTIDMNAFAAGLLGGNPLPSLATPGTQVNCQFWGRDTPGNALLSDALEYFVCP